MPESRDTEEATPVALAVQPGRHAGFGFLQQLGSGDDGPTAGSASTFLPVKTLAAFERVCGYGTA